MIASVVAEHLCSKMPRPANRNTILFLLLSSSHHDILLLLGSPAANKVKWDRLSNCKSEINEVADDCGNLSWFRSSGGEAGLPSKNLEQENKTYTSTGFFKLQFNYHRQWAVVRTTVRIKANS
jgi:hypothetical protein